MGSSNNLIVEKTSKFAIRIVRLYQHLTDTRHEYIMSKRILSCGTSIGEYVSEAIQSDSTTDFKYGMSQGLKAATKTEYWIGLLSMTGYLDSAEFDSIMKDCVEVKKILHSIVKTTGFRMEDL